MALVLFATFNDPAGSWSRGDIVDVLEDGVHPGTKIVDGPWDTGTVIDGKFWLIHVTDATREQVRNFIDRYEEVDEDGTIIQVRRTFKRMIYDALPTGVKNTLRDTNRFAATNSQIRNFLSDIA